MHRLAGWPGLAWPPIVSSACMLHYTLTLTLRPFPLPPSPYNPLPLLFPPCSHNKQKKAKLASWDPEYPVPVYVRSGGARGGGGGGGGGRGCILNFGCLRKGS
uniref:Putative secreted protein n=1 Tax=Anopheles triannulatus TaxID=58253 RepID=A0A2M4B7E9_9DIPT